MTNDEWKKWSPSGILEHLTVRAETAERERDAEHARAEAAHANYVRLMRDVADERNAHAEVRQELERQIAEHETSFDLRWKADVRAIERWRAEHPEKRARTMPDHSDMVVWLMEQLATAEAQVAALRAALHAVAWCRKAGCHRLGEYREMIAGDDGYRCRLHVHRGRDGTPAVPRIEAISAAINANLVIDDIAGVVDWGVARG